MRKKILLALLAVSGCAMLYPQNITSWLTVDRYGSMQAGDITLQVWHYSPQWEKSTYQSAASFHLNEKESNIRSGKAVVNGIFKSASGDFFLMQKLTVHDGRIEVHYSMKATAPVSTKMLALEIRTDKKTYEGRKYFIDGKEYTYPSDVEPRNFLKTITGQMLSIPCSNGTLQIEGKDLKIQAQFNPIGNGGYGIAFRLYFSPYTGDISEGELAFRIALLDGKKTAADSFNESKSHAGTIDISSAANMGFADDTADDRKGGWTDQGNKNDMGHLKPGMYELSGFPFAIIDPNDNQGRSCMVFASPGRPYMLKNASITLPEEKTFRYVYLLHGTAWSGQKKGIIGNIEVQHTDGDMSRIAVEIHKDVADWHNPDPLENGIVVLDGENKTARVGLYLSQFEIKQKPIKRIQFLPTQEVVWMVAAVSGGFSMNTSIPSVKKYTISPSEKWRPIEHKLDIEKSSVLDFSFLNHRPAGKFGRIISRGEDLVYENSPERTIRFYGINMAAKSLFLEKKECELLAERLSMLGYNSVRIHHFDFILAERTNNFAFSMDKLDQLEYLVYCLKKSGIYVTLDMYTLLTPVPGSIKGVDRAINYQEMKILMQINGEAMKIVKDFSSRLLLHKNPYTGFAWKDDPVISSISLINENVNFAYVNNQSKNIVPMLFDTFSAWAKANGVTWTDEPDRISKFAEYAMGIQLKSYTELRDFIKGLGVKAILTDINFRQNMSLAEIRKELEYVDIHSYWDLPVILQGSGYNPPYRIKNTSMLDGFHGTHLLSAAHRQQGKPFMMTEFNFCYPNVYRSEGGPVTAALAGLQGWNGVYRYIYSHQYEPMFKLYPLERLDIVRDPINLLSDKIGMLFFTRGDIKAAKHFIPIVYTKDFIRKTNDLNGGPITPQSYARLSLYTKVGTIIADPDQQVRVDSTYICVPDAEKRYSAWGKEVVSADSDTLAELIKKGAVPKEHIDLENEVYISETGQIRYMPREKRYSAVTDFGECLISHGSDEPMKGENLKIMNRSTYAAVYLGSVSDKPLIESSRLIFLHLTDIQSSGSEFKNSDMKQLEKYGTLPHLVHRGTVDVMFRSKKEAMPSMYAVDLSGQRAAQIKVSKIKEGFSFTAEMEYNGKCYIVYEIVWE